MSDAVSALAGVAYSGTIKIEDAGPRGMILLRGDLADTDLKNAATSISALDFPDTGVAKCAGERGLCWMSPDELLVLVPYTERAKTLKTIAATLGSKHHLAADVSDARAVFRLSGDNLAIREVLAKLTPADMRPKSLPNGHLRRTRLAQVPAAFWFHTDTLAELICFRSVAQYVFGILKISAAPGSEVGHF